MADVKKVLVVKFNTPEKEKDLQITISKPRFNMAKEEISSIMDSILARGVVVRNGAMITTKKSAVYKTTTTDEVML